MTNFLDNISKINESVVSINERIIVLEASDTHVTQSNRIGELEEAMETLSSTFSSLKFKREKAFVGKSKNSFMFPRCLNQSLLMCLTLIKHFFTINGDLHNGTSSGLPKVPIVTSCVVEEVIYLDSSSLGNT